MGGGGRDGGGGGPGRPRPRVEGLWGGGGRRQKGPASARRSHFSHTAGVWRQPLFLAYDIKKSGEKNQIKMVKQPLPSKGLWLDRSL